MRRQPPCLIPAATRKLATSLDQNHVHCPTGLTIGSYLFSCWVDPSLSLSDFTASWAALPIRPDVLGLRAGGHLRSRADTWLGVNGSPDR